MKRLTPDDLRNMSPFDEIEHEIAGVLERTLGTWALAHKSTTTTNGAWGDASVNGNRSLA